MENNGIKGESLLIVQFPLLGGFKMLYVDNNYYIWRNVGADG